MLGFVLNVQHFRVTDFSLMNSLGRIGAAGYVGFGQITCQMM